MYWSKNTDSAERLWIRTLASLKKYGIPHETRQVPTKRNRTHTELRMLFGPADVDYWALVRVRKGRELARKRREVLQLNPNTQ